MHWCFALINGRLAEIYFEERKSKRIILGHCYVKREEFSTQREQQYIARDTKRFRFSYRKKQYKRIHPI